MLVYFFIASGFIGAAIFVNREAIAKSMDEWLLLPRPQRLTELYFTDVQNLPATYTPHAAQNIPFIVHNLEHRDTTYHYKFVAAPTADGTEHVLGEGMFSVPHDHYQTISRNIVYPFMSANAVIKVVLDYDSIAFGASAPTPQSQSIHFLVREANAGAAL